MSYEYWGMFVRAVQLLFIAIGMAAWLIACRLIIYFGNPYLTAFNHGLDQFIGHLLAPLFG